MRMYSYLKTQKRLLLFYGITILIYIALNELYWNKNWNQIIYSTVLVTVVLFIFLLKDAFFYFRKKKNLLEIEKKMEIEEIEFEENKDEIAQIYERMITKVQNEKNKVKIDYSYEKNEMENYYTIWSHQIKTPIAAIKLLLQEDGILDRQIVTEQLFEIEEYVSMNLNYMQLSKKQMDYVLKKQNLDTMLKEVIRKYAMFFIRKKMKLEYQTLKRDIITDEKWFVFVIGQILSNALKYTKKGEISITITRKKEKEYLTISDTGIGIREEDIPRIFDPGYTGFNGRMDKKSTGLGLFMCKKILSNMGFHIWIESQIGIGTTVYISLTQYQMKEDV